MFYEMVEEFVDGIRPIRGKTDWNNKRIYRQTRSSKHSNEDPNGDKILEILDHESIIRLIRKHIEICERLQDI